MTQTKILFTPFKIGNAKRKNLFVMSPMETGMNTPEGAFSETAVDYYVYVLKRFWTYRVKKIRERFKSQLSFSDRLFE